MLKIINSYYYNINNNINRVKTMVLSGNTSSINLMRVYIYVQNQNTAIVL